MFRYVPVDKSYPSEQVATIDGLLELCKQKKVERVIIPMTFDFEGYGADLMSLSNSRAIKRDYKNRVKAYGHELSISAWQFVTHEEFRELIENLQEHYPIYDEGDYSNLESDTQYEFLKDEIRYALDDYGIEFKNATTRDSIESVIEDVLISGDYGHAENNYKDTRLEWWELVSTDNDGLTPYMKDEDFKAFMELFKARAKELGFMK